MSKNKNNKPVWSTRIKKNNSTLFAKVGSSIEVDKRLYKQDIQASTIHVEMLLKKKIIKFREDELHHKDIAYDNGATKEGFYSILDKVIKTSSRIAITISEKY